MTHPLTRRRFLTIAAAAGGAGALGTRAQAADRVWRGTTLGADAELIFAHADSGTADAAIRMCLDEIERLEAIFSLYRSDSELAQLNRDGRVDHPSRDLVSLMRLGRHLGDMTDGAFDMTVQPLWRFLTEHFNKDPDCAPPEPLHLQSVLAQVDYRRVEITDRCIVLPTGFAVTLNGIAQGYITDRVADLLRQAAWRDVLINLGEIRTLAGRTWPVRFAGTEQWLRLRDAAIATSAGAGTPLNADGDWHHLIDPRSGKSANHHAAVTVVARHAVTADALSTALAVASPEEVKVIARRHRDVSVYVHAYNREVLRI